ncbi:MAG: SpoIID/LytB domain-containing protein [Candidatus Omnitrophica bacterium]|nr:SpoIID/LytB domain-containing protein [Candidatus Omnitrophota bacterium]MCM8810803.1 SpoIID/LytB domain-containing protein [Candidatus Omnitrophota bacterium]
MLKSIQKKELANSIFLFLVLTSHFIFSETNSLFYVRMLDGNIIKRIEIEEYISGVVEKEMGKNWPVEALKAQAVVSRTYLIWKMNKNKNNYYDIENSIYKQLYVDCKNEKIKSAVFETKGEILTNEKGEIMPVFFHACSGGITANPSDVWKGKYPLDYSVLDPYSEDTPYSFWEKNISKNYLSEKLQIPIKKIEIVEKDKTNRAKLLNIITKNGNIIKITGTEFRERINQNIEIYFNNPYIIPSTMFEIIDMGENIIFKGKGYGHGVGLSQWGARKMAEIGFDYKNILKFYFPYFQIKKIY